MLPRDPFDDRSPFSSLDRSRRQRLLIDASRFLMLLTFPVLVPFAIMFVTTRVWQSAFVLVHTSLALPISWLAGKLAAKDQTKLGGFILAFYFQTMIMSNGILIDGLYMAVAPSLAAFVVMGGMVLGSRGGYLLSGTSAVLWLFGSYLISQEWLSPVELPDWLTSASVTVIIMAGFSMIAYLSQLATRDLRRALDDATYDLVQANRQLEVASNLKSQFTARTSHELRTPLSAIIVFTDMMLRKAYGPITEKQQVNLGRVLLNAKRLSNLIDDVLDLTKIESGEIEIIECAFPVNNLVATARTLESKATEKNIQFSVERSPDIPPHVVGDEKRITQIMVNLVGNAIKFTEKGKVEVLLEPKDDNQWGIIVRDTGRGIQNENLEKIFEEFWQENSAASDPKIKGTGLGLAISQQLARAMGGKIQVMSKLGQGSIFEIVLPLKKPEDLEAVSAQHEAPISQ